jgi:hypothetical protein
MLNTTFLHERTWSPRPVAVIPCFYAKLSTHRMHDPGSIVPHIQPKVLTDNQIS